jgi:hypothetical protein
MKEKTHSTPTPPKHRPFRAEGLLNLNPKLSRTLIGSDSADIFSQVIVCLYSIGLQASTRSIYSTSHMPYCDRRTA